MRNDTLTQIELKVKEEVDKLIKDVIKTLDYITQTGWISNIVPVPKKDGDGQSLYIDLRNLNLRS